MKRHDDSAPGMICEACGGRITSPKYFGVGREFFHMTCPDPDLDDTVPYSRDMLDDE